MNREVDSYRTDTFGISLGGHIVQHDIRTVVKKQQSVNTG